MLGKVLRVAKPFSCRLGLGTRLNNGINYSLIRNELTISYTSKIAQYGSFRTYHKKIIPYEQKIELFKKANSHYNELIAPHVESLYDIITSFPMGVISGNAVFFMDKIKFGIRNVNDGASRKMLENNKEIENIIEIILNQLNNVTMDQLLGQYAQCIPKIFSFVSFIYNTRPQIIPKSILAKFQATIRNIEQIITKDHTLTINITTLEMLIFEGTKFNYMMYQVLDIYSAKLNEEKPNFNVYRIMNVQIEQLTKVINFLDKEAMKPNELQSVENILKKFFRIVYRKGLEDKDKFLIHSFNILMKYASCNMLNEVQNAELNEITESVKNIIQDQNGEDLIKILAGFTNHEQDRSNIVKSLHSQLKDVIEDPNSLHDLPPHFVYQYLKISSQLHKNLRPEETIWENVLEYINKNYAKYSFKVIICDIPWAMKRLGAVHHDLGFKILRYILKIPPQYLHFLSGGINYIEFTEQHKQLGTNIMKERIYKAKNERVLVDILNYFLWDSNKQEKNQQTINFMENKIFNWELLFEKNYYDNEVSSNITKYKRSKIPLIIAKYQSQSEESGGLNLDFIFNSCLSIFPNSELISIFNRKVGIENLNSIGGNLSKMNIQNHEIALMLTLLNSNIEQLPYLQPKITKQIENGLIQILSNFVYSHDLYSDYALRAFNDFFLHIPQLFGNSHLKFIQFVSSINIHLDIYDQKLANLGNFREKQLNLIYSEITNNLSLNKEELHKGLANIIYYHKNTEETNNILKRILPHERIRGEFISGIYPEEGTYFRLLIKSSELGIIQADRKYIDDLLRILEKNTSNKLLFPDLLKCSLHVPRKQFSEDQLSKLNLIITSEEVHIQPNIGILLNLLVTNSTQANKDIVLSYITKNKLSFRNILKLESINIDQPQLFIQNVELNGHIIDNLTETEKIILFDILVNKKMKLGQIVYLWENLENKKNCLLILLDALNNIRHIIDENWLVGEIKNLISEFNDDLPEYNLINKKLHESAYSKYFSNKQH